MLSPTKLAVAFFLATSYVACSDVFRRFDYKLSFKGPHLVVMDGSIPFWEYGGRKYMLLLEVWCYSCQSFFL